MLKVKGTSKKIRIVLFLVEILLIIKMVLSFMQPRTAYSLFVEDMVSSGAVEVELEGKGWYIDNSIDLENSNFLRTAPVDVPGGTYRIIIHHWTDGDGTRVNFSSQNVTYRLIAGRQNLGLDKGCAYTEYEINLSEAQEDFVIEFEFTGNGFAWIAGVDIMQLWNQERLSAMYTIIIISIMELLWYGISSGKIERVLLKDSFSKSMVTVLSLCIPIIISTLPCFSYYIIEGFDLNFHLMRIEGIAESIKSGCFPARIQTNWLDGYGYPVSVFYGDLLLYFPAVLRVIGMSIQGAYKWYLFFINVLTSITMYLATKGMTNSRKMGILASYLYLLLPYRLSCIYTRSGVGEYSAMAFFPLIVWGLYRIYKADVNSKKTEELWIIPVIGFTGVIQSHLLSTILVGIFTTVCCLIMCKKTFSKKYFWELLKIVLITIAANAIHLIPILDYMQKEYNVAQNAQEAKIQTQGAFLSQIFSLIPLGEGISLSVTENLFNPSEIVLSLGIVAWCGIIVFLIYFIQDMRRRFLELEKKQDSMCVYLLLSMAIVTTWMSSYVFPWDAIASKLGDLKIIFTSIQFPWRYLSLASVFFVLGIAVAINSDLIKEFMKTVLGTNNSFINIICLILIGFVTISAGYFVSNEINNGKYRYIIADCDLDDSKIMGAEYIPFGVDERHLLSLKEPESSGVAMGEFHSKGNEYEVFILQTNTNGTISVPRIYYDGYAVNFEGIQEWFECYSDDLGRVCFDVPEEYQGKAVVKFREPWYWRVAEIISLITMIYMGILLLNRKQKD